MAYDSTASKVKNLEMLSAFLRASTPPPEFNMLSYIGIASAVFGQFTTYPFDYWEDSTLYSKCGTVACAVGHGPLAGIRALDGESWTDYAYRCFICYVSFREYAFSFLFGSQWVGFNNTPGGAADRIDWYLSNEFRVPPFDVTATTSERISSWNDFMNLTAEGARDRDQVV